MPNSGYQYKYNGKECQDELNLNLYDYGARNYDAALGRWMNMDALSEKYYPISPYTYALNNPMFFVDPDGNEIWVYFERGGREQKKEYSYEKGRDYSNMNGFEKDIYQALDALYESSNITLEDGTEVNVIQTLMDDKRELSVAETKVGSSFTENREYLGSGKWKDNSRNENTLGTIFFNSKEGVAFNDVKDSKNPNDYFDKNGNLRSDLKINSPTSILGHEAVHAYNFATDSKSFFARKKDTSGHSLVPYFKNKEEAYTTTLSSKININLGENPRCNHRAVGVITQGVLSNKPIKK